MQFNLFQQLTQHYNSRAPVPTADSGSGAYQHNLDDVQSHLPAQLKPRLVVKSLANLRLKLVSETLNTQRFMVFHLPHLMQCNGLSKRIFCGANRCRYCSGRCINRCSHTLFSG